MKKTLLAMLLSAAALASYAQTLTTVNDGSGLINSGQTKLVIRNPYGGAFFTGWQSGSGYTYSQGIFRAVTDNPNGSSNLYYEGVTNGVTNFYVRADGLGYMATGLGIGTGAPVYKLHVAQDVTMNGDIDAAQFSVSGATDQGKRLVVGYDVNGTGFGFIKAGWYQHQWTNLALQPNDGKVGIGTTNFTEMLTVGNDNGGNNAARKTIQIGAGGYAEPAAFNTASLGDKLILFNSPAAGYDSRIGVGTKGNLWFKSMGNGSGGIVEWYTGEASKPKMVLSANGYLGIGTQNPDNALTVQGTVHASKVLVDAQIPVPDYVFEKDYKLRSLKEVEAYIKVHKHLPEVASAKEMKEKGVDVNEMNMKLLQKVEELTLYLLKRDSELSSVKSSVKNLKKQLTQLNGKLKVISEKSR